MDVVLLGAAAQGDRREGARRSSPPACGSSTCRATSGCATPTPTSATTASSTPRRELLGTFVYGLPELNRERIRAARYVASPGCFATTIELALLPLASAGLLAGAVEVVGITGSSGAGVAPVADHAPPDARGQPPHLQAARAPAHPGDRRDARRRRRARTCELRFVPVSAPLRAASSPPASPTSTAGVDAARTSPRAFAEHRRGRAVRARARRSACPRWSRWPAPTTPRSASRSPARAVGGTARGHLLRAPPTT